MNSLIERWIHAAGWGDRPTRTTISRRSTQPPCGILPCPEADEAAPRCGWFQSSWELSHGLAVIELADVPRPFVLPRRSAAAVQRAGAV